MTGLALWVNSAANAAPSVRLALWCEALSKGSAIDAAMLVDCVARAARKDSQALAAWLGLVDFPSVLERVGAGRLHEVLEEAEHGDLAACALAFGHHGKRPVDDELGPPPDPVVDRLSLGHRKTAVRGGRSQLLERLLKDPDPSVVAEALKNPRLREREVVAIATRRPCPEKVFWHLAGAPQWMARGAVRRAVVLNPYAPPRLSAMLLVGLTEPELRFASEQEGLHRAVREGALKVLEWERRQA